ncbi:HAMP domain-containing histidine kinase [Massilia kyonggiensis]|nr:HAMP domain-containing histidine kinase [Massilia kyonggiensis]
MNKLFRLSAANLALAFVGASVAALALFAAALWYAWSHTIGSGREAVLASDADRMAAIYQRDGMDVLRHAIDLDVGRRYGERLHVLVLLTDDARHPVAGNLPAWPDGAADENGVQHVDIDIDGRPVSTVLVVRRLGGGYRLLVGRDVQRFETLEDTFLYGLLGAAALLSVVGVGGGFLMRRGLLAQVQSINQATHEIVQGNLSHRLPARVGADELDALVDTVNRMLDQIENLVEGVRNVSNSIAHDLRTPLSELRSRLEELAVTRPAPDRTWAEIDGAIADVDRVIGIFNALLRMAELDTGVRRAGFVDVDAAHVAIEAAEFYQPVAELRGMTLCCEAYGPLPVRGDPLLLAQALGNLIDNAIKYGPEHGAIHVGAMRARNGSIELSVADTGRGIPDEEKPRVSERFYRGDASRGTPGVGLGLSLVASVAKLHGGRLALADNEPGLKATIVLPG